MKRKTKEQQIAMNGLQRAIYGENLINDLTYKAVEHILPQLQDFIGKKILLISGNKAKSFKIDIPTHEGIFYRAHLSLTYDFLTVYNDTTVINKSFPTGGYGVQYHKKEHILGNISDDGILTSVEELQNVHNFQYEYADVKKGLAKIEKLAEKKRELESEFSSFTNKFY